MLGEFWECDRSLLEDRERIEQLMRRAAEAAEATVVASASHHLEPQGVSCVVLLEESHCSVHTWPEFGYAAVDFFTCGTCRPELGHRLLARELGAGRAEVMILSRGRHAPDPGIQVVAHDADETTDQASRPQTAFAFGEE